MNHWIWAAIVSSAIVAGCQTGPFTRPAPSEEVGFDENETGGLYANRTALEPGLRLSAEQRFSDIPLPHGLKAAPERTFVYETADLAVGRTVYKSKSSVNELAQFYIDECPAADWELERLIEAEDVTLLFRKPGKQLTVMIRDLGLVRSRLLILTMTPEPKP